MDYGVKVAPKILNLLVRVRISVVLPMFKITKFIWNGPRKIRQYTWGSVKASYHQEYTDIGREIVIGKKFFILKTGINDWCISVSIKPLRD